MTICVCWKGKNTNYKEIADFIDSNQHTGKLQSFEKRLEDTSLMDYYVYLHRFKNKETFIMISKSLGISTARITESLNSIMLAFQIFFEL